MPERASLRAARGAGGLGLALGAVLLLTLLLAAPASAAPPAPEERCTVTDRRLAELSGLAVAPDGGIWAMSDGGSRVALYELDPGTCAVTGTRTAPLDPYDAEDLALAPDGAFWVADTGDNDRVRDTVALLVLPADGAPRLHRLTYPDGPHDAEALLIGADGVPVVVTKEVSGTAGVYRPAGPLAEPGPTPLMRAGSAGFPRSDTRGGPIGTLGAFTVTGGATSADRGVVALRTYTDAWLYRVPPSGDLVAALQGTPLQVPLPDEPQGEALAFLADGTLLSGSETRGLDRGTLRAVPGAAQAALAAAPAGP
ncbi:esterase-like activity of phytase family protein, partial [Pseudonocardia lutea]